AKTVVIEDLWKFQGERHELLTPGEYTQFTGRAGRRGIDELGHAVVVYQKQVPFERVASLASTRTYELTSSFRPSYNMAVNLVRNYTREEAHHLLNSSFAQFLADRSVVALERELERRRAFIAGYRERAACHLGDFSEYWALRERADRIRTQARTRQSRRSSDATREAVTRLRPGDVVYLPEARRRGLAAVVSNRDGKATVVTQSRNVWRVDAGDFDGPPDIVARVSLPKRGNTRSSSFRRDVAARLVALDVRPPKRRRDAAAKAAKLDRRAAGHPCHACPERAEHERWASRAGRMERDIRAIDRRIKSRTETVAVQFDRVLRVLEELGYVRGFTILPQGETLARIYGEGDILVSESIHKGLFAGVSPAELAALVSTAVYESRERVPRVGGMPTGEAAARYRRMQSVWRTIRRVEDQNHVELCRELDAGFAEAVFSWAEGKPLEDVLGQLDMAPGDFVRNCKMLADLLRQIEAVAPPEVSAVAHAAVEGVNRGVVAYTGV
ncbi:MAG: RNA helicase, partial [Actinobacteria bacterium]|nr:RNA helicase [Actinomycetota bacterium]